MSLHEGCGGGGGIVIFVYKAGRVAAVACCGMLTIEPPTTTTTSQTLVDMELSWRFRICHYLNKNPTDFKYLVKTLRYNNEIIASDAPERRELNRVFLKYENSGPYPESLIERLCQHFTEVKAREMIAACFTHGGNLEAIANHKDYTVKCPTELVIQRQTWTALPGELRKRRC